jgi:hypothetical protein
MTTNSAVSSLKKERASFSDKETAKILNVTVVKLYRICKFFDLDPDDEWDLIQGEFFDYAPGQAKKRRFYEEGVMAIAKYLEETEGTSFLAKINEFFTHHRARVTRALVTRRIIQVTQDRSAFEIQGDLLFLDQRALVKVLGTNGRGMVNTIRRIEEECAEGKSQGLKKGEHFADFEGKDRRHWSQLGLVRLAKNMHEKGKISKARKSWVKAVEDVGQECLAAQLKFIESHEARIRAAKARARAKAAGRCTVTQQRQKQSDSNPIVLDVHHLFDAATRPDLAALDENLLVITSSLHSSFHQWMGSNPCTPEDFVDYLLTNELTCFQGSASTQARQEQRLQKLIYQLEQLQSRFEGNRLLY